MEIVGLDTETHRFRQGEMTPKMVCLSWALDGGSGVVARQDAHDRVRDILAAAIGGSARIVGAYAGFDARVLMRAFPDLSPMVWQAYEANGIEDVQMRERLLDIATGSFRTNRGRNARGYGLDAIVKEHLGIHLDKSTWRMMYNSLDGIPVDRWPEGARDYARIDAEVLLPLWRHQQERADRLNYDLADSFRQSRADFVLQLATSWGIRTDPDRVRALDDKVWSRMRELHGQLYRAGLMRQDGTKSLDAIRERIRTTYPGGDPPKTDKGAIKTDGEVLDECDDPVLEALAEYASLEKTGSTYVKRLFDGTVGPIHCSYDTLGAESGRSTSFDPNLQNQPRVPGVRECFVARPGTALVACDFDSQEMRTWAQVCQDIIGWSTLAENYRRDPDFDPHTLFASALMGVDYREALRLKEIDDPTLKDRRQQSKAGNFGLPAGMGAEKFRSYAKGYGVTLTEKDAEALKRAWLKQYPEAEEYFLWASAVVKNAEETSITQLRSGRIRGKCRFTQVTNGMFQGLAADASKEAIWQVGKRCFADAASPLYGCRPVLFVHDEIVVEAPEGRAHDVAKEMERVMIESQERWTPNVPARASAVAMRRWSKKAKAIYDPSGRMLPWDDTGRKA